MHVRLYIYIYDICEYVHCRHLCFTYALLAAPISSAYLKSRNFVATDMGIYGKRNSVALLPISAFEWISAIAVANELPKLL